MRRSAAAPRDPFPDSIDALAPSPENPRAISERASDGLRASIERFGDIAGIVWNATSGRLVAGHQRVEQLRALGGELDGDAIVTPDGLRFPVRVVRWDETTERAALVAANNPAIQGAFTMDLEGLLAEIRPVEPDAFDSLCFDELLSMVGELSRSSDPPEPKPKPNGGGESFRLLVECPSAIARDQLAESLADEGFTCRAA